MSYIINLTDGTVLTTINDGTTNTSTGLTLIGRNYISYGDAQNENFIKLLENFSDTVPPTLSSLALTPLKGTLWFDSGNSIMKVYDGVNWVPVSQQTSGATPPNSPLVGDQWYDSGNQQLYVWTGSEWHLIGPSASVFQGKTGVYVEIVNDTLLVPHTVVNTYKAGNLISVASGEVSSFTPTGTTYSGFTTIVPGINLSNVSTLNGTASNSELAGGILPTLFARRDQDNSFNGNITLSGDVRFLNAEIFYKNNDLVLKNKQLSGNVNIVVNTPTGEVSALNVSGNTGRMSVPSPLTADHVTNKTYVDTAILNSGLFYNDELLRIDSEIAAIVVDYNSKITESALSDAANLRAQTVRIDGTIGTLSSNVNSRFSYANVRLSNHDNDIAAIENYLTFVSNIASPVFTGNPRAPTPVASDNDTTIATTAYVTRAGNTITTAWTAGVAAEAARADAAIINATSIKANIASPVFTGVPRSVTPTAGNNSSMIATTAFVNGAIESQKFNYTVSTSAPSGGTNGDFWFRIA